MAWNYIATAAAAYLIGAIPFGYMIYFALTKQDVRQVGSGNIGATNVGRLLGFRFFLLVFTLDLLKGLLPVYGLPWLTSAMGWPTPGDLPVAAALGAILGHNFPVYLGFKGGKGVATSLGALLALAPVECGVATAAFFVVFFATRYVSLSSMIGGIAFAAAYFWRVAGPWSREHRAMSVFVIAVVVLLIVRHRKNISRLLAGTESRVNLRRRGGDKPPAQPAGMIRPAVVVSLAVFGALILSGAMLVAQRAQAPVEATAGPWLLRETHREATGQQRSEGLAFDEAGERLVVLCPRYNHVLVYRVDDAAALVDPVEIAVEGRPVGIAVTGGYVAVLQRPVNDAKHLGPGWLDLFSLDGAKVGLRTEVGYYPDDLAATPDGAFLLVVTSGRGEGDSTKHAPEVSLFAVQDLLHGLENAKAVGHVDLNDDDDPERIVLSYGGGRALAMLRGETEAVMLDLADPTSPKTVGRLDLRRGDDPYLSKSDDGDWIIIPARLDARAVVALTSQPTMEPKDEQEQDARVAYLVVARPEDSSLELRPVSPSTKAGRFPILGPLNLTGAQPIGLAYNGRRRLLAAATKPGSVHVIQLESRTGVPAESVSSVADSH